MIWAAWAAVGAVLEAIGRPTLSAAVRSIVCRPRLRRVTLAGWLGFSAWFAVHIWG